MSEDNKKEEQAGGGKRRLPAFVLVAIGAVIGGAGVVFTVPPRTVTMTVEPKRHELIDVIHPDPIKKTFNPRTKAGKGTARVEFKFVYTVREDREQEALARVAAHWEQANSNALMLLKRRSLEELQTDTGLSILEHDLVEELDRVVFPGSGSGKVARVTRILWGDLLFQ